MKHNGYPYFLYSQAEEIDHCTVLDRLDPHHNNNQGKHGIESRCVQWAPDYSYLAWSSGNCNVQLIPWSREKQICILDGVDHLRVVHNLDCKENVWSVAFGSGTSQNTRNTRFKFDQNLFLATGLQSGRIKLWNCHRGSLLMVLFDHKDVISGLHFASDFSMLLVSASHDGTLKLWDLNDDGNMYQTLRPHSKRLHGCKWSPDRKYIACVGDFKCAVLWKTDENKIIRKFQGHHNTVMSCDFSPDGVLLATASYDSRVIIWDCETGEILRELCHLLPAPRPIYAGGANDHFVRYVSFSADGAHVASTSDDGYVRIWELSNGEDPCRIAESDCALCCSFSPDGSTLAVGNRQGVVEILSVPRKIESLQHLSRMAIRRQLLTTKIDHLHLPLKLKEFLGYKHI